MLDDGGLGLDGTVGGAGGSCGGSGGLLYGKLGGDSSGGLVEVEDVEVKVVLICLAQKSRLANQYS